jgi:hypothetical protein
MPICVYIINLASKQQCVKSMCTFAANTERNKIFLWASNLLQSYNKKCSAFSVGYPQEQGELWIKLAYEINHYAMHYNYSLF